jgi:hypothetical protein
LNAARLPRPRALALLVAWLPAGCGEIAGDAAVRLGDVGLTVDDLRAVYAALDPSARPPLTTRDDRRAFAQRVIDRMILVEEGERLEAEDPAAESEVARERAALLVRRLRVLEAGGAAIDSASVATAFERMRTRHRVQTAYFAKEEEARQALARVEAGEPFERLLARGPGRGGDPDGWIAWSPFPDAVADAIADAPLGSVVGPVAAGGGWRLLRVVERAEADAGPTAEQRPAILIGLRNRRESDALGALANRLLATADVRVNDAAIDLLAGRTRDAILRPGATEQDPDWALPALAAGEESTTVAVWSGGRLDAGDYVRLVALDGRLQRPRSMLRTEVRRAVNQEVATRVLVAEAEARRLGEDWWVQRALGLSREDRAVQRAVREIERRAGEVATPADSLAVLLQETQPSLFRRAPRARVLRFDLTSRAAADAEVARIRRAGGPLPRLVELLEGDPTTGPAYHVLSVTPAEVSSLEGVGEILREGAGTVSGPYPLGDLWIVLACLDVSAAPAPTRDRVLADLRARTSPDAHSRRVEEWVRQRARERGVAIDEDVLDALAPGG